MRITIDTDDKGKVNIDTGDKGNETLGLAESTTDMLVIDAGPAPIQEIERQHKMTAQPQGESVSASASPQEREAQLPLNPLRAGAAAAYENPANLRKRGVTSEGAPAAAAAKEPSRVTIDGGSAQIPKDKKQSDATTPEQQPPRNAKGDKKR